MKKKIIIALICIITVSICIGSLIYIKINILYDKYTLPKDAYIKYSNKVNLFENKSFQDLITNTNVKIISKDINIDTNTTGTKDAELTIKYNKKKYYYTMKVNVVDVNAPIILSSPSTVTTTVMNVAYPCDKALYIDDYDERPSCVTEGEYDITTPGTYELKYIIKDKSGNEVTKDVNLKVIEYGQTTGKTVQSNSTPIYFSDVVKKFKTSKTMIGIDVSKWQGTIDFNKVKDAGCEFVIIRIGVQAGKNYDYSIDSNFKTYLKDAKAAGLKVGVYLYNTSLNYNDGVKAAKWVIDTLNGEKLDLGVSYDWENYQYIMEYNVSLYDLYQGYVGFKKTLTKAGYNAHFYAAKNYLENFWIYVNEPVWLAHYTSETDYAGEYYMWQRTGNGKIDGVESNYVDIDILYK